MGSAQFPNMASSLLRATLSVLVLTTALAGSPVAYGSHCGSGFKRYVHERNSFLDDKLSCKNGAGTDMYYPICEDCVTYPGSERRGPMGDVSKSAKVTMDGVKFYKDANCNELNVLDTSALGLPEGSPPAIVMQMMGGLPNLEDTSDSFPDGKCAAMLDMNTSVSVEIFGTLMSGMLQMEKGYSQEQVQEMMGPMIQMFTAVGFRLAPSKQVTYGVTKEFLATSGYLWEKVYHPSATCDSITPNTPYMAKSYEAMCTSLADLRKVPPMSMMDKGDDDDDDDDDEEKDTNEGAMSDEEKAAYKAQKMQKMQEMMMSDALDSYYSAIKCTPSGPEMQFFTDMNCQKRAVLSDQLAKPAKMMGKTVSDFFDIAKYPQGCNMVGGAAVVVGGCPIIKKDCKEIKADYKLSKNTTREIAVAYGDYYKQ